MTPTSPNTLAAFVGLAWAAANHDGGLQAAGAVKRECFQLAHTPEAIDAWGTPLRTRLHGHPVASCLELNKGPWVCALRTYALLGLCPLHPLTWARYRAACTPRRAQDDPSAAARQLVLRLTPRDKLQPLHPHSPTMRALAQLGAPRRRVGGATVRLTNRLTSTLKNSVPQGLPWLQEKDPHICCDLLSRWPPLKAAPRARRTTLETFVRDHHVCSEDVSAQRRHALTAATPFTTDEGGIAPKALLVQALVAQLRVTLQALADFDTAIAQRAKSHPAFPLLQALPGAGPVCAPACSLPLANHAHVLPPLPHGNNRRVLPRSPHAAGRSLGDTGASSGQRSSAKRLWRGRRQRSGMPSGPSSTTNRNGTRAQPSKRPYGPWRSNGAASSSGVGRNRTP
jgi:hypothetical protein